MKQYLNLVERILKDGSVRGDRTGTGTRSIFGEKVVFDLREGFPILTTKKMNLKGIVKELEWFMRGDTSLNYLLQGENPVHIWNQDSYRYYKEIGGKLDYDTFISYVKEDKIRFHLGDIYGKQWRNYGPEQVDQLVELIAGLYFNPEGRRHILNAWNPSDIKKGNMALPPCHVMTQWYINDDSELDCQLYVRSNDVFLGMPFNISSYAIMMEVVAEVLGITAGKLHYIIGDAHLYQNHIEQAYEIISREPFSLPKANIRTNFDCIFIMDEMSQQEREKFLREELKRNLDKLEISVELVNYESHPHIKAPLSVGL